MSDSLDPEVDIEPAPATEPELDEIVDALARLLVAGPRHENATPDSAEPHVQADTADKKSA